MKHNEFAEQVQAMLDDHLEGVTEFDPNLNVDTMDPDNWFLTSSRSPEETLKGVGRIIDLVKQNGFTHVGTPPMSPRMRCVITNSHIAGARIVHGGDGYYAVDLYARKP